MDAKDVIRFGFYAIGYGGLLYSLFSLMLSVAAKRWRQAEAKIVYSSVEEDCDSEGCSYKARVVYNYIVRGRSYSSERVGFGYLASSISFFANRFRSRFKLGSTTNVYYNPSNPKSAVLIVGLRSYHLVNIAFFVVFVSIVHGN